MPDTRTDILAASLTLFNGRGFVAVTMRDIADKVDRSVGNVGYHFRNKDEIILALHEQMRSELATLWSEVQLLPTFENIDSYIEVFLAFQKKYRFFFTDVLEVQRRLTPIKRSNRRLFVNNVGNLEKIIEYSVGQGIMAEEPRPGAFRQLAHAVWTLIVYWPSRKIVVGAAKAGQLRQAIWGLVVPFLSDEGLQAFDRVFGYESLVDAQEEDRASA